MGKKEERKRGGGGREKEGETEGGREGSPLSSSGCTRNRVKRGVITNTNSMTRRCYYTVH